MVAGILGKANRIEVNPKIFINNAMLFLAALLPDLLLRCILQIKKDYVDLQDHEASTDKVTDTPT